MLFRARIANVMYKLCGDISINVRILYFEYAITWFIHVILATLRSLYKYTIQVLLMMIILSSLNIMEDNGEWVTCCFYR